MRRIRKIEKGLGTLLAIAGWHWCYFCENYDTLENFPKYHQHQNPTEILEDKQEEK